jgi:hypothetical protein
MYADNPAIFIPHCLLDIPEDLKLPVGILRPVIGPYFGHDDLGLLFGGLR